MRRIGVIILGVASLLVCINTSWAGSDPPIVAVFNIEAKGVKLSADVLDRLTDYLGSLITAQGYRVVPRSELKTRLGAQKKVSYRMCYDTSCQIEIGKELAAQKTLSTQVLELGGSCKITVAFYDLKKSASEGGKTVSGDCTEKGIVESLEKAIDGLASKKLLPETESSPAAPIAVVPERPRFDPSQEADKARKNCENGDPKGCNVLGFLFIKGRGGSIQDEKEAAELFRRACEGGNLGGCVSLGRFYYDSLGGVSKDRDQAAQLFRRSCDGGINEGCQNLGMMYLYGEGGFVKDPKKAMEIFQKICDGGYPSGCGALGFEYYNGNGWVARDVRKANGLFLQACQGRDGDGCTFLGINYAKGYGGLIKDEKAAADLFRKGCEGGSYRGCYHLGLFYVYAQGGLPKDNQKAAGLIRQACKEGDPEACDFLKKINW